MKLLTKSFLITTALATALVSGQAFGQAAAPAKAADAAQSAAKSATTKVEKAAKTVANPVSDKDIADAKAKGMVWVNLNSKVYHTEGEFYGHTKEGKFMTEDEAKKAGYRAAKEPVAKKKGEKSEKSDKK